MTSTTRNFRQALGMAAIAALALAGSLAPARAANHQGSSIMTMKQDLADREGHSLAGGIQSVAS
jgi:hypothetical protein